MQVLLTCKKNIPKSLTGKATCVTFVLSLAQNVKKMKKVISYTNKRINATATVKQTGFMATNILNGNTPVKDYLPTSVDEAKEKNNRLISIDGQYRTVITADGTGIIIKGERNWKHWIEENEYVTDF